MTRFYQKTVNGKCTDNYRKQPATLLVQLTQKVGRQSRLLSETLSLYYNLNHTNEKKKHISLRMVYRIQRPSIHILSPVLITPPAYSDPPLHISSDPPLLRPHPADRSTYQGKSRGHRPEYIIEPDL